MQKGGKEKTWCALCPEGLKVWSGRGVWVEGQNWRGHAGRKRQVVKERRVQESGYLEYFSLVLFRQQGLVIQKQLSESVERRNTTLHTSKSDTLQARFSYTARERKGERERKKRD